MLPNECEQPAEAEEAEAEEAEAEAEEEAAAEAEEEVRERTPRLSSLSVLVRKRVCCNSLFCRQQLRPMATRVLPEHRRAVPWPLQPRRAPLQLAQRPAVPHPASPNGIGNMPTSTNQKGVKEMVPLRVATTSARRLTDLLRVARNLHCYRYNVAKAILKHIINKKPERASKYSDEEWKKQLRLSAVQIEAQLYQHTKTREQYLDLSNLGEKITEASQYIMMRSARRRLRMQQDCLVLLFHANTCKNTAAKCPQVPQCPLVRQHSCPGSRHRQLHNAGNTAWWHLQLYRRDAFGRLVLHALALCSSFFAGQEVMESHEPLQESQLQVPALPVVAGDVRSLHEVSVAVHLPCLCGGDAIGTSYLIR